MTFFQLHLDLFRDAVLTVKAALPLLLSRGDLFEISRAYLLLAKCVVANAASGVAKPPPMTGADSERRLAILGAIQHLKKALEGFKAVNAHQRVKDTLYMMVKEGCKSVPMKYRAIHRFPFPGPNIPRNQHDARPQSSFGGIQSRRRAISDKCHVEISADAVISGFVEWSQECQNSMYTIIMHLSSLKNPVGNIPSYVIPTSRFFEFKLLICTTH